MTRKYPIAKLMQGKGQQNAKKLCKSNKNNKKEYNFLLHIEKLLKLSRNKKALHQRALKSLNNIKDSAITYEMALQFDNLYVEDSKSVNAKEIKIQGLKELNLIHLDLLQQQVDQINDRDKRIRILEQENKNLKARLERIDRRVSLTLSKKLSSVESLTVDTYIAEEQSQLIDCETQTLSRLPNIRNSIIKPTTKSNALPDKASLDDKTDSRKLSQRSTESITLSPNVSQILRTSPREKRIKKDSLNINISGEGSSIDCGSDVNDDNSIIAEPKTLSKKPKFSTDIDATPDIGKKHITDHSLRSRDKQKDVSFNDMVPAFVSESPKINFVETLQHEIETSSPSHTVPETSLEDKCINKVNDLPNSLRSSILTTDVPYFLSTMHHSFINSLSPTEESSLEIPKWRVRSLFPLYVMEGTENLGEDIFGKRHAKPENDERRRKRWDLQRMREQRQYDKLRERYDSRHNSPGVRPGSNLSLWPTPDALLTLCVEPEIPVCAFGQPLAIINQDCFCVPWLTKGNQTSPKKKHR